MGQARIFHLSLGYLAPSLLPQAALWNESASWRWFIALQSSHQYKGEISFVWMVQMWTHPQLLGVKGSAVAEKLTPLHPLFGPGFELCNASAFRGHFCYSAWILNLFEHHTLFGRKYHRFARLFLLQSFHFTFSPHEVSDNTPTATTNSRLFYSLFWPLRQRWAFTVSSSLDFKYLLRNVNALYFTNTCPEWFSASKHFKKNPKNKPVLLRWRNLQ